MLKTVGFLHKLKFDGSCSLCSEVLFSTVPLYLFAVSCQFHSGQFPSVVSALQKSVSGTYTDQVSNR